MFKYPIRLKEIVQYKTAQAIMMLASGAGIFDTLYLVNSHYNDPAACTTPFIDSIFGIPIDCGAVTTSVYSTVIGIPISLFGFLFYITFFSALLFDRQVQSIVGQKGYSIYHVLLGLSILGFIISTLLLFIQIAVLQLICLYCMASVLTSYILFGVSFSLWSGVRRS